jgi:hypothetical protein
VAPLTTINPGWVDELGIEGVPPHRIHVLSELPKRDRIWTAKKRGWSLINYEYVRANPEILAHLHRDTDGIILDESTRIRAPKTQTSKAIIRQTRCEHRALLSGLPNPESAMDWFNQMVFLKGDLLDTTNYWAFRQKWFRQLYPGSWDWRPRTGTMARMKREVHQHVFVMTAKKAGMGFVHVYEKRMVEMNRTQRVMSKSIIRDFAYGDMETKWVPVQQMWLARLAGGFSPDGTTLVSDRKLKALHEILKEEIPKKAQLVVWARFRSEIKAIRRYLTSKHISVASMTGSTDRLKRRDRIKRFQAGKLRVLVIQEKLGMYGLNLSAADVDVYYSNMWDNEVRSQCEKRIEHLTKKRPLLHIDLMTRNSVDEEVIPRLRQKKLNARMFHVVLERYARKWRRVFPSERAA